MDVFALRAASRDHRLPLPPHVPRAGGHAPARGAAAHPAPALPLLRPGARDPAVQRLGPALPALSEGCGPLSLPGRGDPLALHRRADALSQEVYEFLRCARGRMGIRPVVRATEQPAVRATPGSRRAFSTPCRRTPCARSAWRPRASPGSARCATSPRACRTTPFGAGLCAGAGRKASGAPGRAALRPVGRVRRSGVYRVAGRPPYGTGALHAWSPLPHPGELAAVSVVRLRVFRGRSPWGGGRWTRTGRSVRYREWQYGCTGVPNGPAPDADGHRAGHRRGGARARACGLLVTGYTRTPPSGTARAGKHRGPDAAGGRLLPPRGKRAPGRAHAGAHRRLEFDAEGRSGVQVFSTCRDSIRTLPA